jgi:Cu-Zn family superoxide dismutase
MTIVRLLCATAATAALLPAAAAASAGPPDRDRDADLPQAGVFLEGIGVDQRAGVFYVSATNQSGAIYRGFTRKGDQVLELWQPPRTGDNGRGIDVDHAGRVYVAGGPTAEVRVLARDGQLLAELPTGAAGSFLNDVWVGPDGAAYLTDSSLPIIWRVSHSRDGWRIERWLDVAPTITYTPALTDFDLGGIVTTTDRRYLLTAQGTTGQLWRIDLHNRQITEVDLGGARLTNADGIVLRGHTLWVVQNFARQISKLRLRHHYTTATLDEVVSTPADRTFTTAKRVGGRLLVVDSKFGFPPTAAVAEDRIVTIDAF